MMTTRTISIDRERCTACGLCATHCTEDVILRGADGAPRIGRAEHCLDCGHCAAVCPAAALTRNQARPPAPSPRRPVSPEAMESFLRGKRSCRFFRSRPLEREQLARLVDIAATAPSSKNCQERTFIVVTDRQRLDAIRGDLVKNNRKICRLLRAMLARPLRWLLPKETVAALRRILGSMQRCLEREAGGEDAIFYDAPAVVFIGGIRQDVFGKDNALAAQHYLMAQAEAMGIGSCIMGYAQAAPRILAKHLEVPRFYRVYGVVALGQPRYRFHAAAERKPAVVDWVEAPATTAAYPALPRPGRLGQPVAVTPLKR